jgi:4-amino-4-deoxy-L-arabinose transferase-like glycosyltransferase
MYTNKEEAYMKRIYIYLCIITLIGGFLRFYQLGSIPNGLYQDETAIGYNAYSISETGKDEHGRSYPLYFESFGDQKLPVYIYATVIAQQIFGVNAFSTRFMSALTGTLSIFFIFFLVYLVTKRKNIALLTSIILALNPWHIHYSRATFEVSIVLLCYITGIISLLLFFEQKKKGFFVLATLLFILSMYSYNLTRLLSPVLFGSLLVLFYKKRTSLKHKEILVACILGGVAILPLIITLFTAGGASSASGTLIHSSAQVQAPLLEFKSYFIDYPLLSKIFNIPLLTLWKYLMNIAGYLSIPFYFVYGSSHGNHGIGTQGLFYLFELPFFLLSFFAAWKLWGKRSLFILLPAIATILVCALTRDIPHATRSYPLLLSMPLLIAAGYIVAYAWTKKQRSLIRYPSFGIFIVVAVFGILYFFASYFIRFPIAYAHAWRAADRDIGAYLKEHENEYSSIIIDTDAGLMYTSILFYTLFPPGEFQQTVQRSEPDSEGFTTVNSFGKYRYKSVDWEHDTKNPHTLIITGTDIKGNPTLPVYQTFMYPRRPVVISLKQEIISYPVEEIAYRLYKTTPEE